MLKRWLEARWLQEWAARLGFGAWAKLLLLRHDLGSWDKARRVFGRREDPFRYRESPYEHERFARMERMISGRKYERALEIGCAEGVFTRRLAPLCGRVVALDVSAAALERARRAVPQPHVSWIKANARLWRGEGRFDLVVLGDFLYYLGDPRKGPAFSAAVDEFVGGLCARLEPGGRVLLANGYGDERDLKRNLDYRARFEREGLRLVMSETSGEGPHDKTGMRCLIDLLEKPHGRK